MFITKNTLASATFAIALATASSAAIAGEPTITSEGKPEVKVDYADLDLSKAKGLDTLNRRIKTASKKVCFVSNSKVTLSEAAKSRECMKETVSRALAQVETQRQFQANTQRVALTKPVD